MRVTSQRRKAVIGMVCAAALMGCDLTEPYSAPAFGFGESYTAGPNTTPILMSHHDWWRALEDPTLNGLVVLALRDNLSLAAAEERVVAARAAREAVPFSGSATPSAQINAVGARGVSADVTGQAQFGFDWLFDPYGARRNTLLAADARIEVAEAEVDAARLLVLFNLANAYADLRYRQELVALSHAELGARQETLAFTNVLLQADAATRLEVTRSQARVAEIRAELPQLQAAVTTTRNQIAVLAGVAPGDLPSDLAGALAHAGSQPIPQMAADVGIPADLVRNRPDILVAERTYYAAVAEIGVARAQLYPRLSLTGSITLRDGGLGTGNPSYVFGPAVQFPSLPLGATRAAVEQQHSVARQAHLGWQNTVLTAVLEVENALADYNGTVQAVQQARSASRLYGEALGLTREIFQQGEATLSELIIAQQALSDANRSLANIRRAHTLNFIALNIRLGAGHGYETSGNGLVTN